MLSPTRSITVVLALAALVRLWMLPGIPLIITNDSTGYLMWGEMLLNRQPIDWPAFRTPGYPLFNALVFFIAGVSPFALLIAQHLLAVAICGMIAFVSLRLAGPRLALVLGGMAALDPWLLAHSAYALTEILSAFLLVLAATVVLTIRRPYVSAAIALGLVLASLVLVRPAFQLIIPFLGAGWLLAFSIRSRTTWLTAAVMALAFLVASGPWLWHNYERGIVGFSKGGPAYLWIGIAQAKALDEDYPVPEDIRETYDRIARGRPHAAELCEFLDVVRGWDDPDVGRVLGQWARHSIRSDPGRWAGTFVHALGWQLCYFHRSGPLRHDFSRWQFWRLTQDGRDHGSAAVNFQFVDAPDMSRFAMHSPPGPQRIYFATVYRWRDIGLIHAAFLVFALAAMLLAMLRSRWLIVGVFAGTIAYYITHAAFLFPEGRYSFPCWMVWYMAPPAVVSLVRTRRTCDAAPPDIPAAAQTLAA